MITRVESEILLFAYEKYLSEEPLITPGEVAEVRKISRPAAQAHLKKLSSRGMGRYFKNKGFAIGEGGKAYCRHLIRKHRILETYLCRVLGLPLEKACEEAHNLQYHASEELVERLCEVSGNPSRCPHGLEIPGRV